MIFPKTSIFKKSSSYQSCDETSKHETDHGVVDISKREDGLPRHGVELDKLS